MDRTKVEAMKNWPQPCTIKDLQCFLGFANSYRRFICGYSGFTTPLTSLLRMKPKHLCWTSDMIKAFQNLKAAFCKAPTLLHPDPTRPFIVEVDASSLGVERKLSPSYIGPFSILRQINKGTYELQLPSHYHISPTFHVSLLKPITDPVLPPSTEPEVPPAPEIDTDDTVYWKS
ncbi:hypothetical protein QTP70_009125 [Hemibagrus guttatus]|uniref:Tf2-1-like SH3-like domain-containing protein n=1 Tax=Hemibagrus guttatus TaxID=175788 RepID=A0AAE0PYY3_9TELE|nr:hypothetical protein QTP70_009125 [Hemibagrus guttatus]